MTTTKPFDLRIQYGIAGGFAPANSSAVHTFHFEVGAPAIQLSSMVRPDGTPFLQPHPEKAIYVSFDDTLSLTEELESLLRGLPTKGYSGLDAYGQDIGIMYQSEELSWTHSSTAGCGWMENGVKPNEEQKKQFQRVVEIAGILEKRGVA